MNPGPLRLPEGVTMKNMRSKSSRGKITSGCSIVAQLEFGDGGSGVVGVKAVRLPLSMERGESCTESNSDAGELGETPDERRRLSSFSALEASNSDWTG